MKHIHSAPYHPSSNGLAERFVRTFKRSMKAGEHPGLSFDQQLMSFLLAYRTTPHATTKVTPASLFLMRHIRTRLDLLVPNTEESVTAQQAQQKLHHDNHCRRREFAVGQRVLARNQRSGPTWIPGTIVKQQGPLSYQVQVAENRVWRRHVDHLHESVDSPHISSSPSPVTVDASLPRAQAEETLRTDTEASLPSEFPTTVQTDNVGQREAQSDSLEPLPESESTGDSTTPGARYPQRVRRKPDWYQAGYS